MTRQQQMAAQSYAAAAGLNDQGRDLRKSYRSYALSTPAMLLRNGLVQTVAFLHSRSDDAAERYLGDLARTSLGFTAEDCDARGAALYSAARGGANSNILDYMVLSEEILNAATWLRRMAQSELSPEPNTQTAATEVTP